MFRIAVSEFEKRKELFLSQNVKLGENTIKEENIFAFSIVISSKWHMPGIRCSVDIFFNERIFCIPTTWPRAQGTY